MLVDPNGFQLQNTVPTVITLNDFTYPLHNLEVSYPNPRQDERPKMQQDGRWGSFQRLGGMDIHIDGDIFGSSSADYMDKRLTLIYLIRRAPIPADTPIRWIVSITLEGVGDTWSAGIDGIDLTAPVGAGSPSRGAFTCTFHSPDAYFLDSMSTKQYFN